MRTFYAATLLLCLGLAPSAFAEDEFPGVEKLMDAEQFKAAGLDKLSAAERAALNNWLIAYTAGEAEVLRNTNEEVRQAEVDIRIESRVKEPFTGWSGKTRFYLENGQVWQQRLEGRYAHTGSDRQVVIGKNFFGFYKLTVPSTGAAVGVTRIK